MMIAHGCHSALYGCFMHNFLRELSQGCLTRVQVQCGHSWVLGS
jgi:hypothetical protein